MTYFWYRKVVKIEIQAVHILDFQAVPCLNLSPVTEPLFACSTMHKVNIPLEYNAAAVPIARSTTETIKKQSRIIRIAIYI